jgi:hypothetical protein
MKIINNYNEDILKSLSTPLLIELSKNDLNAIGGYNKSYWYTQEIYDNSLKNKTETNVIFIDGDKNNNVDQLYIFEQLIDILSDDFKDIKNIKIVRESLIAGCGIIAGGTINDLFNDLLGDSIDIVTEKVFEFIEDFTIDKINDKVLDEVQNKKSNQLYLSQNGKKAIKELIENFKNELSPAQSFRLVIKLLLSIAIEQPKLIFIKNPHKLDKNSLAILSLFLSYSKNIKDEEKHTGISFIYAYEDDSFQPYIQVEDKYKDIKKLLDEQRIFAQRYSMLERPTSDIPRIAVKSSYFVGRIEELQKLHKQYYYSKKNKNIATLEVISGEPGIGKTKLIKKHIEQIRQEEENGQKIIQLTILNQVGHTSTNTGIGSLIDSIIREIQRLETIQSFQEKVIDKIERFTTKSIYENIRKVLGVDDIKNIGGALKDRITHDDQMLQMKLNTFGDIDNKPQQKKEQQFMALTQGIKNLLELSDEKFPIVLFIDDLQWIDEDSSEYIIKYLIKGFNLHIVTTLRPSDATTVLAQALENVSLYPHKIALLNHIKIKSDTKITNEIDTSKLHYNPTHLFGLDSQTLTTLIAQVIQGDIKYHKILADTIIRKLSNEINATAVNTLFAVETINMLCDEKLYSSQEDKNIEKLITTDTKLRFNDAIENFEQALHNTFEILLDKYKKSLSHYHDTTDADRKFNLMAYAILEERLHILKIYFKEHGNAAVNTLLFASLLGTPFNSEIVKNILESLSSTEEPLLQPLKEYILQSHQAITLTQEHYEIIEEVYEILSRYISFENSYEYRHTLLNLFLEKQLEYQIDELFGKDDIEARDRLFDMILNEIAKEEKKQEFYEKELMALDGKQFENMLFFSQLVKKVLRKGFERNKIIWVERYCVILNNLGGLYSFNNQTNESLILFEECFQITKSFYQYDESIWAESHTQTLNNLADLYANTNQLNKAILLWEEVRSIIKEFNIKDKNSWKTDYILYLNNLGDAYRINHQVGKSIDLLNEALYLTEELDNANNNVIKNYYLLILNTLALSYSENHQIDKAKELLQKALAITEELYPQNNNLWIESYIQILCNLASIYNQNHQIDKAKELMEKALAITEELYSQNNNLWIKSYLYILNGLGVIYSVNNEVNAIYLLEKALAITEELDPQNNNLWIEMYIVILINLASAYSENYRINDAIELFKKSLELVEKIYRLNKSFWINKYLRILNSLADLYNEHSQIQKAALLYEKSLHEIKILNMKDNALCVEDYIITSNRLALLYHKNKKEKQAFNLFKEAYRICKKHFGESHPQTVQLRNKYLSLKK